MQNKLIILLTILLYLNITQAEQSFEKNDFAYGSEIEIAESKSVISVPLSEDVYLTVKNSNLEDLAVFNARGEPVPHIIANKAVKTIEAALPAQELTLFPFLTTSEDEAGFNSVEISTEDNGTIIKINNNNVQTIEKSVRGYLLDATKLEIPIQKLQFSLENITENYVIKLRIDGSQDLKNWSTIEGNAVLANFILGEEGLRQDEVDLKNSKYKYYRITSSLADINLTSVKAHFASSIEKIAEEVIWKQVNPTNMISNTVSTQDQADVKKLKLSYFFDLLGHYPVQALKLNFADQNSIARFTIEAAHNELGPWVDITSAVFYKIKKDEAVLIKEEVRFSENRFRFWRLHLNSSQSGIGNGLPSISFGWRPNTLQFLARGEAPYTLAYGSADIINHTQPDLLSLTSEKDIGVAQLKQKITLGGVSKLESKQISILNYKKVVLWIVLILAVILLGRMALQLKKELPPV